MTNAVAVVGLTYRGTDIQNAFGNTAGFFLEITRGLSEPANVRGTDVVIPGRIGRFQGARVKDIRRVVLEGIVWGTINNEPSTFRTQVDTLLALFDPTVSGSLVAVREDASTKTLTSTRALPTILWDDIKPGYARVSIELESTTPDWA